VSAHRVLVVDDEPPARAKLRALLGEQEDFVLAGECGDGPEAIERLRTEAFDLVLLDVQMPGCDGLEVVRTIGPAELPPVVFVTAHDQHAVRAFEVHALDYLLKPFDRERFGAMLARARQEIDVRRSGALALRLEALLAAAAGRRPEPLALRAGGRTALVEPGEILWVEAADNYSRVHLAGRELLVRGTLSSFAAQLEPHGFLRIHRSLLVNPEAVRELVPQRSGEVVLLLRGGTRLTSSRAYRRAIDARWPRGTI